MKKKLVIVLTTISFLSCQKSELEFSCDPVINEFIIEHRAELSGITIHELTSYDFQLQRAIFNSWDYQKKRSAWIDKLQQVQVHMAFTESENDHIQSLIAHITEDYFLKENIDNNPKIRSQFAAQWISYSINELGWSKQFVAFMVYRLYTDQSQFDSELSILKLLGKIVKTDSETGDCDCNVSVDFCGNSICSSSGCKISTGCGWLWSMSCDGNCFLSL